MDVRCSTGYFQKANGKLSVCSDAFAFLLYEILLKISYIFFNKRVNVSGRVDKKRGKIDTMRPFETRSGSTLVE